MIVEHYIQRKIMAELLLADTKRYKELKPKNIESNLFLYHMRELIKMGYVEKRGSGVYALSRKGGQYADRSNLSSLKNRVQPKQISILMVRAPKDRWLLLNRTHKPFLGYVGFPSGKIHFGEMLSEAAHRELEEKAGLSTDLTLRGNIHMRFFDTNTRVIVSDINAYVWSGKVQNEHVDKKSPHFFAYIGDEQELFEEKTFKGHKELLELLAAHTSDYFFAELDFISDF
jgi:ADP-ribose pyrophosphatase YjhB (NUDIX family)